MNLRHRLGVTPTQADLTRHLTNTAHQAGDKNRPYDAANSSLRLGGRAAIDIQLAGKEPLPRAS